MRPCAAGGAFGRGCHRLGLFCPVGICRLAFSVPLIISPEPETDPRGAEIALLGGGARPRHRRRLRELPRPLPPPRHLRRRGPKSGRWPIRDAPRREAEAGRSGPPVNREHSAARSSVRLTLLRLRDARPRRHLQVAAPAPRLRLSGGRGASEVTGYLTREQIRRLDRLARTRAEDLEEGGGREAERAARWGPRILERPPGRLPGARGRYLRRAYLDRFPDGIFAKEARADLRSDRGGSPPRNLPDPTASS